VGRSPARGGIGHPHVPAGKLELIAHEARAVHRLDRGGDREIAGEAPRQRAQAIGIRRGGAHRHRLALLVEKVKVETLAAQIQTGVQHEAGLLSVSSSGQLGGCHWRRPSFIGFLQ
jgi:hypothetical protein